MSGERKTYTPEFKSKLAIEALRERYAVSEIADHFGVHTSLVHAWRTLLRKYANAAFRGGDREHSADADIRHLEQQIDELRSEQEWMRKIAVERIDMHTRRSLVEKSDADISILRQTHLLGLHRSGVYYQGVNGKKSGSDE